MSDVSAQVAGWCDEAGLDSPAGKPLRLALMTVAQAAADTKVAAEKVGREAGQRAGQAAAIEVRAQLTRMLLHASWLKRIALAGSLVLAAGGGWWAGQRMPQVTPVGRLTPAQAETLRWNDFGALLDGCAAQTLQDGRKACAFTRGWWLSPPQQPK